MLYSLFIALVLALPATETETLSIASTTLDSATPTPASPSGIPVDPYWTISYPGEPVHTPTPTPTPTPIAPKWTIDPIVAPEPTVTQPTPSLIISHGMQAETLWSLILAFGGLLL